MEVSFWKYCISMTSYTQKLRFFLFIQERKRAFLERMGGKEWAALSEAQKEKTARIADFGCCNHKMDNTIQKAALGFKDVYRQNPGLQKPVSIPNRKQAMLNELQQAEARQRQQAREAQQAEQAPSAGVQMGPVDDETDKAENIVEDLLRANETGDTGGLVCAVICSEVFGDTDSQRPGALSNPLRNWIVLKVKEAEEGHASEK